jgi:glycosyltransferase involved in cell wall biosynthesis
VGDINWNKNIPSLIEICQELNYPLVIVGSSAVKQNIPVHPWTKDLLWLQSKVPENQALNLTGFVPNEELPVIYSLATFYCQPSYAEGFGLPPIQAMACGCPVICNLETSLKELYSSVSLSFKKENLKKFWNNSNVRKKYSNLGLNYTKNFSWEKTAQKTLKIYEKYQKTK